VFSHFQGLRPYYPRHCTHAPLWIIVDYSLKLYVDAFSEVRVALQYSGGDFPLHAPTAGY
jgi:hypothetical protein